MTPFEKALAEAKRREAQRRIDERIRAMRRVGGCR